MSEAQLSAADENARRAALLNRECFCMPLDRACVLATVERKAAEPGLAAALALTHPNLIADAPVFVTRENFTAMRDVVSAIERTTKLEAYRAVALGRAHFPPDHDLGGAFMGYDFHLAADGPRLIEINTNAGGAFIAALLPGAFEPCCAVAAPAEIGAFEDRIIEMFLSEWRRQRGAGRPARIAIVDDAPHAQYLRPDFLLAQRLFLSRGVDAVIADAADLDFRGGRLLHREAPVDLVYNRLVDFALADPAHAALRAAFEKGAAVVTPNPLHHALFADKRNLVFLSDPDALRAAGLDAEDVAALSRAVPKTMTATRAEADALWAGRRNLFFKPFAGHGSKAVYRGEKLTRAVFERIALGGYVAQEFAPPGIRVGEDRTERKVDIRLYTYDGAVLLAAARVYQGQTTNFRTPGGGFAPIVPVGES